MAIDIVDKIYKGKKKLRELNSHTVNYGNIVVEEEFIDVPSHNLQQIFDKLCIKNYDNIQYFDSVTSEFKVVTESDAENYLKIISFNTINGVEYEKLKISLRRKNNGYKIYSLF